MSHYFTNENLKSEIKEIKTSILGHDFVFLTDNGVFSKDKIDFGSRLFLENIDLFNITGKVLDVGCGYGTIGLVVSKLTSSEVTMCDVNKRALHLAEMNLKANNINNVNVVESDCYSNISGKFDYILTNPPIRAGKKIVYEIVMNARNYLTEKGTLYIVVRKEQGAKSMIRDLEKYYHVSILEKSKGFFIIKCQKIQNTLD